jgi:hypothetical protein
MLVRRAYGNWWSATALVALGRRCVAQPGMLRTGRLVTLPERMQEVQAFRRFGEPSTRARTRWMFGSQRRLVLRWE